MNHPEQAGLQIVIAFENASIAFKSDLAINQDNGAVDDVPPGVSAEDHAAGMSSSLANLAAYLAGPQPPPRIG